MKKRKVMVVFSLVTAIVLLNTNVIGQKISKKQILDVQKFFNVFSDKSAFLERDTGVTPTIGREIAVYLADECIKEFIPGMKSFQIDQNTMTPPNRGQFILRGVGGMPDKTILITQSEIFSQDTLRKWIIKTASFDSISPKGQQGDRILIKAEFGIYTKNFLNSTSDDTAKENRIGIFLKAYLIGSDSIVRPLMPLPKTSRQPFDDYPTDDPTAFDLGNLDP